MSAGSYIDGKYQASYADEVHPIRVQPETVAAIVGGVTNATAAGGLSSPISARASGQSKRTLGLGARRVTLRFTTTVPAGYAAGSSVTIPALTPAFYAACINGATGTYLGAAVTVTNTYQEVAR